LSEGERGAEQKKCGQDAVSRHGFVQSSCSTGDEKAPRKITF
jgi:hypothetical protein